MKRIQGPPSVRFWRRVEQVGDCWEWMGSRNKEGYGNFRVPGGATSAHRFAYEDMVAPIPEGLHIDHLCRNRACVNPDHLDPVTQKVNINRGNGFAVQRAAATACDRGHELTPQNTYAQRVGGRRCRECNLAWQRARYAARKQVAA